MSSDRQLTAGQSTTSSLLTLFSYAPAPKTINVYTKNKTWTTWTTQQYETHFSTTLVHGVVMDSRHAAIVDKLKAEMEKVEDDIGRDKAALTAYLEKPEHNFNLTYVGDGFGYRTIASRDLRAGEIIGIYSAELLLTKLGESTGDITEDDMGVTGEAKQVTLDGEQYTLRFRATAASDLTRQALHAPDIGRVGYLGNHGLLADSVNWRNVLVANVAYHQAIYQNIPVCYFKAKENIAQNSLIKINWGAFWQVDHPELPKHQLPRYNRVESMATLFHRTSSSNQLCKLKFQSGKYQSDVCSTVNLPTTAPEEAKDDRQNTPQR